MKQSTHINTTITRACPHCDLLQALPLLEVGQAAYCVRCNCLLGKVRQDSLNRSLAFALTGIFLFILANIFPFISLSALGVHQDSTLFSTTLAFFEMDRPLLALIVFLTTILFPLLSLLGMIVVLLAVKMQRVNRYFIAPLFRFLMSTDAWGMLEVFLLAVLVAIVKLGDLADIVIGVSMYAFIALIMVLTLLSLSLDPDDVWQHLRDDLP
jgi:paraquat-inducible protein A